MEEIDALESRITSMELKVFGKRNPHSFDFNTSRSASQALLDVNVLISSALSGREMITSTLKRLPELNECLDPNYVENLMTTEAKVEYILAMEPEIKNISDQLKLLSNKLAVLDSEPIQNTLSHSKKLEELSLKYLEMKEENDQVSTSIIEAIQKYNEIIYAITENLNRMEATITNLEIAQQTKKVVD